MLKRRLLFPVMALVAVAVFTGCGKDDPDPAPPQRTNTEKITSSSWRFQSATAAGTDISSNPQLACFVDNVITFNSNLTGNISEGANVCVPTTAGAFTWSFGAGETTLQLSTVLFPGGSSTFTIVSLTDVNLVLSQNVVIPPSSSPIPVTVTFQH